MTEQLSSRVAVDAKSGQHRFACAANIPEVSFEPLLIPKHERRFTGFDDKIIALYARG